MKILVLLSILFSLQIAKADITSNCVLDGIIDQFTTNRLNLCKGDTIVINSSGGDVSYKNQLNLIFSDKTLICVRCYSLAAIVFSQHKGPRYITKDLDIMFHLAFSTSYGSIETAETLRMEADALDKTNKELSNGFSGISSEEYLKKITDDDWYPTLQEMQQYDLADGTVSVGQ